MRDDASLRRLAEMGVDVYVPRGSRRAVEITPAASMTAQDAAIGTRGEVPAPASTPWETPATATVLLLAGSDSKAAVALLKDVTRTLGFARIVCASASSTDQAAIATAAALVMFGDGPMREVGAFLPAQRQRDIGWVVSAEPSQLARDAQAKRALWSELKRMARELSAATQRPLAARVAGDDHRLH